MTHSVTTYITNSEARMIQRSLMENIVRFRIFLPDGTPVYVELKEEVQR